MTATNRGGKVVESEFYPTPPEFVQAILPYLPAFQTALEPFAGDGAVVRELMLQTGLRVDAIELDEHRGNQCRGLANGVVHIGDAFAPQALTLWEAPHDLIISNTPFSLAQKAAELAIRCQRPHGGTTALFVPQSFLGTAERFPFWQENPCDWYQCNRRPEFVATMGCKAKKKGCGYRETLAIDAPRPTICPLCGARTTCSTTDAREYGWAVWRPGGRDHGRMFWIDVKERKRG